VDDGARRDLSTIGVFTLVGLPYVWIIPVGAGDGSLRAAFSRTARGWLLVTQVALAVANRRNGVLGLREPDLVAIAWLALLVAFALGIAGHRRRCLPHRRGEPEEPGLAGALGVVGYRLAMLASGALALFWSPGRGGSRSGVAQHLSAYGALMGGRG